MKDANGNVFLHIPAATLAAVAPIPGQPSKDEIIQMQAAQIRELENLLAEQRISTSTIAHVAMASALLLIEHGHGLDVDEVSVPVELRDRVEGGHITVSEGPDRSYVLRVRTRGEPEDVSIASE